MKDIKIFFYYNFVKNFILKFFRIFFITIITFFFLDFLIGNYIYKKILRKNYFDVDVGMGEKSDIYHHGLKKNYKTDSAGWGKKRFSFCTDNHGFRNDCNSEDTNKYFNIGIIGDSFTAGHGLTYEELYSTIIKNSLKNKKIANLSSASYSPAIYYAKINYLIKEGYKFDEIIVFLDLSDLQDDVVRYELDGTIVKDKNNNSWVPINYTKLEKFGQFISRKFKVTYYLLLNTEEYLIKKKLIDKKIPNWVLNTPRSSWTYAYDKRWFDKKSLEESTSIILKNMDLLSKLLKNNNINLSVAVYPWPSTLFYDNAENIYVNLWKNFCKTKCIKFYNLMEPFFDLKQKMSVKDIYFKYYIDGDVHFNENGSKFLAENFLIQYNN